MFRNIKAEWVNMLLHDDDVHARKQSTRKS